MSNALNIKLGPCKVYVNGVDVGHTIGGVTGTYTPEFHETKVDEYTAPVERYLIGETLKVNVPMAESTYANLKLAIPHGVDNTDFLTIGSKAGKKSSTYAKVIRLHPIVNGDTDYSDDLNMYKAHATNEIEIGFKNDGEKVYQIEFTALVDESRADGNLLGLIGDSL